MNARAAALDVAPGTRSVRVRTDVPDSEWDAYVQAHAGASPYLMSGWAGLIARAFGHEPCLLAASTGEDLTGVLPLVVMKHPWFGRFVISLPFLNAGGVLADDDASATALLDAGIAVARDARADYLELRHTTRRFPHLSERSHKVAMTLRLADTPERQWEQLDRKVRNQVRKGEKSGLRVEIGGAGLVAPFYGVFARNMRDLGTPVFGIALFQEVLRTFPESSRVLVAYHGGTPVAAAVVHWRDRVMEVNWASALRESNPLSANILLYWQMITFAIASGCDRFEFGRCTPGEGTFYFKRQWGAEPSPLVWEYWAPGSTAGFELNPSNPKYSRAVDLWRRLPVRVATLLGPRIVRNIPC